LNSFVWSEASSSGTPFALSLIAPISDIDEDDVVDDDDDDDVCGVRPGRCI
jgi:hypothetical protein